MDKNISNESKTYTDNKETKGVKTLLGTPKKAIITLAIPMIIAMAIQTIYNLVDAFWVAGLGADAIAATGFVFPFFFLIMALSNGIGTGAGSAISRRIGAKQKDRASNVASHALVLMVIFSIVLTIPLYFFAENIFAAMGAGDVLNLTVIYGQIIFAGVIFLFFQSVANSILRGEGDAKRPMYAMVLSAILNMILDPIFIFDFKVFDVQIGLNMGIAGAAYATILSMVVSCVILLYWLLGKKDTYVDLNFKKFKFNLHILKEIFSIGLPASLTQLSLSITQMIMTFLISTLVGVYGVAVYSLGWRIVSFGMVPIMGIGTAVISVVGASVGEKMYTKTKEAFYYSVKLALIFGIIVTCIAYVFAPEIAAVFTQAESSAYIQADLISFLRIICFIFPLIAFGMLSSSMFQGAGKGMPSVIITVLQSIVLSTILSVVFVVYFGLNLEGFWFGIIIADAIGAIIGMLWAGNYLNSLIEKSKTVFNLAKMSPIPSQYMMTESSSKDNDLNLKK